MASQSSPFADIAGLLDHAVDDHQRDMDILEQQQPRHRFREAAAVTVPVQLDRKLGGGLRRQRLH